MFGRKTRLRPAAALPAALLVVVHAAPGLADVKQVRLGIKGATCAT